MPKFKGASRWARWFQITTMSVTPVPDYATLGIGKHPPSLSKLLLGQWYSKPGDQAWPQGPLVSDDMLGGVTADSVCRTNLQITGRFRRTRRSQAKDPNSDIAMSTWRWHLPSPPPPFFPQAGTGLPSSMNVGSLNDDAEPFRKCENTCWCRNIWWQWHLLI